MTPSDTPLIRVSATSSPFKVAGAIAHTLRDHSGVNVQSIGAGALNQSLKALVYARRYLEKDHLDLLVVPEFVPLMIEEKERTAVLLHVIACLAITS